MPKIKTRRGAAKRFKVTGSGKIAHRKAFRNHNNSKKTSKQKRRLRNGGVIAPVDEARIRKQIPYL